ncbi:hypothetical protein U9M48_032608 [Paspalum notatum var. saurae]|uniref:Increased DNA methylation 1 n=1 Tax=Paspalum notatum var. saurae TaxID=547442 RepID=A0AAQ3U878_PASNO
MEREGGRCRRRLRWGGDKGKADGNAAAVPASSRIASACSKQLGWLLINKMDGKDLLVEIGMREEDIATMLFGRKVAELVEDAFDSSKEERKIFESVFSLTSIDGLTDHHQEGTGHTADAAKGVISSSTPSSSASSYKTACCRIVESFTAGNLSSYRVFSPGADQQAHQAMISPDAGPSQLALRWTPPPPDRVYTRRVATCRSERARICSAMDLENIDIRNFGRHRDGRGYGELWNHLRLHAHLLMVDAGWKIEGKERGNKSKVDLAYLAPDKVTRLFSLPRAWKCFGQWLLITTPCIDGSQSIDYGKEWSNLHEFVYDLKNALQCLQYEVQRPKQSLSFLQQWQLLDPFMAVVCIDKKVAALKNGVALKAINSTVTFPSHNECKLLNAKNSSRPPRVNCTSNYTNPYLSSCKKSLLLLFSESDCQPDNEGNSLPDEESSLFCTNNACEDEADQRSLCMSEINERGIRNTAHRIVMGLHDTTAFLGSRQTCLSSKKKFPCIKSKEDQKVEDKADPLYFPPSCSSALGHRVETTEILDMDNCADIPDEMFLVENELFAPEVDDTLLGITDDINNKQHYAAVVSEPQSADKDAVNGPSGALSLPPEKYAYTGAKKDCIDNGHHDPMGVFEFQMAKDARCKPSGTSSLLSENGKDLEDDTLLGVTDDINNEHHDAAVVSEPQSADKDARNGPSGALSLPPEKDAYMGASRDCIDNGQYNPVVVCEFQIPSKDAECKSSGTLSPLSEKGKDLEANKMSMEDPAKTDQLPSEASGRALMVSEPQVLFVSPQDGTLSFVNNSMDSQDMLTFLNVPPNTMDTEMQLGTNSLVYEASLIQGFLYLDSEGSPICWTVMNPEPPRHLICASDLEPNLKKLKQYGEMNLGNDASTSEHKGSKRPDKVSDIQGNVSRKKQKVNGAPLSTCISQYMDNVTDNPTGPAVLNEGDRTGATNIKQIPFNLLLENRSDMDPDEQNSEPSEQLVSKQTHKKEVKIQKETWSRTCKFDDDDLLMTAVIHKLTARYRNCFHRRLRNKLGFRRLPRHYWENEDKGDRKKFPGRARTVLNKLLEMGIIGINNIFQCRGPGGKNVLKDGNVTKSGIRCRCCGTTFTMSKFKCHAGLRQEIPSLSLFSGTGKSYSLCQLQAWSIEQKVRKEGAKNTVPLQVDQNDDACGSCGDGGELICCDNCPASYHQGCLPSQDVPDGNWYCSCCLCNICQQVINSKELRTSLPDLECLQCERQCNVTFYSSAFLLPYKISHLSIYTIFRSRVGVPDHLDDGLSCTILRNNGDQKVRTEEEIALMAECNMKLMIALSIMEECFLPILDPRTGIDIIPSILYNWRSDFVHLDHKGFYTVVMENDDSIVSVASIRLHGAIVAEMPLVATCTENRQQGMCRRLLDYIEEMLKSLKVEMLLLSAIPHLVETWTSAFGFREIDDSDKKQLSKVRLASIPGTVLLKKNLCECAGSDTGEPPSPKPFKVYSRMPRNRTGLNVLCR